MVSESVVGSAFLCILLLGMYYYVLLSPRVIILRYYC